jgi:hypothetical protein
VATTTYMGGINFPHQYAVEEAKTDAYSSKIVRISRIYKHMFPCYHGGVTSARV